jgi:hypothetical protein
MALLRQLFAQLRQEMAQLLQELVQLFLTLELRCLRGSSSRQECNIRISQPLTKTTWRKNGWAALKQDNMLNNMPDDLRQTLQQQAHEPYGAVVSTPGSAASHENLQLEVLCDSFVKMETCGALSLPPQA